MNESLLGTLSGVPWQSQDEISLIQALAQAGSPAMAAIPNERLSGAGIQTEAGTPSLLDRLGMLAQFFGNALPMRGGVGAPKNIFRGQQEWHGFAPDMGNDLRAVLKPEHPPIPIPEGQASGLLSALLGGGRNVGGTLHTRVPEQPYPPEYLAEQLLRLFFNNAASSNPSISGPFRFGPKP